MSMIRNTNIPATAAQYIQADRTPYRPSIPFLSPGLAIARLSLLSPSGSTTVRSGRGRAGQTARTRQLRLRVADALRRTRRQVARPAAPLMGHPAPTPPRKAPYAGEAPARGSRTRRSWSWVSDSISRSCTVARRPRASTNPASGGSGRGVGVRDGGRERLGALLRRRRVHPHDLPAVAVEVVEAA